MKNLRTVILIALAASAINANATLVDHGDYFTDTTSGLDWLKLLSPAPSGAIDKTYQEVTSQMGPGGQFEGWSYANGVQFDTLLTNQGISPTNPACSNGYKFCDSTSSQANNAAAYELAALFGNTMKFQGQFSTGVEGLLADVGPLSGTASTHYVAQIFAGGGSFFGGVNPNGLAGINTHYSSLTDVYDPSAQMGTEWQNSSSFLIRPSAVPIPDSLSLFASGLIGIFATAKRRIKSLNK